MNKITKSSTKEDILKALDKALEEQSILHKEAETLQNQVDIMTAQKEVKDATVIDLNNKVVELETQIVEDDIKKKGLITQLASQTTDIELAKKKTEKYGEIKSMLESTRKELEMVKSHLQQKKEAIKALNIQLTKLEEELTKPEKQTSAAKRKWFTWWKTVAACSVVVFIAAMISLYVDVIIYPITTAKYDNGVIAMSLDPSILTLTAKDESGLGISGVDVSIAKWAEKAGYDGILYGKILKTDEDKIVLTSADVYDYITMDINKIAEKFEGVDCYNILALVHNPDNIILPAPFKATSQGELEFYESRRKIAGFIPVLWGKNKRVLYISSDNVHGFISSNGIFMKVEDTKAAVSFEAVEAEDVAKEDTVDKASEVVGVDFSKAKGWIENVKNLCQSTE